MFDPAELPEGLSQGPGAEPISQKVGCPSRFGVPHVQARAVSGKGGFLSLLGCGSDLKPRFRPFFFFSARLRIPRNRGPLFKANSADPELPRTRGFNRPLCLCISAVFSKSAGEDVKMRILGCLSSANLVSESEPLFGGFP